MRFPSVVGSSASMKCAPPPRSLMKDGCEGRTAILRCAAAGPSVFCAALFAYVQGLEKQHTRDAQRTARTALHSAQPPPPLQLRCLAPGAPPSLPVGCPTTVIGLLRVRRALKCNLLFRINKRNRDDTNDPPCSRVS